jgi:hypothetical protein
VIIDMLPIEDAAMEAIRWFEEIGLTDVGLVGGKGANLGELTAAGLPVPPGFVVTADAYLEAVAESGARARLARLLGGLNADDHASLAETHQAARAEILATTIPAETADAIADAYRRLGDDVAVAVRSSGTTEDAGDSSFAGMNASFTNVIGLPNLLARVKDCWASLYGERVLAYRAEQHLAEEPAIAVIIQKMIFSEVSGVMFTADPTSGALDQMIIESVYGQGEAIVSGRVEPDTYIVDKAGPQLISVRHGRQKVQDRPRTRRRRHRTAPHRQRNRPPHPHPSRDPHDCRTRPARRTTLRRPPRPGMGPGSRRHPSGPVSPHHHPQHPTDTRTPPSGLHRPHPAALRPSRIGGTRLRASAHPHRPQPANRLRRR